MSRPSFTENDFVQMLRDGSSEQFAILYDAYSGALFGIVKRIIPDEEQASDVLQDAFIKIWDKRNFYDPSKGSIFTWMLNIVRNTAIDFTRSKHFKGASRIQNIDDNVGILNRMSGTHTNTDVIGMNEAVDNLPEEQRQIIDLMYFNGMSQDEIANEYNIPLGTVKTRARGAMIKLRALFKVGVAT